MKLPRSLIVATILIVAVVVQSTLFGRMRPFGPDLTLLVVILLAQTKIKSEMVLLIAFGSGLLVDLLGSSLVGLRAVVFTLVAYVALRTHGYADIGRFAVALWAGLLTFLGLVLLVVIGTLFGQTNLVGADIGQRLILLPLANMVMAALLAPLFIRVVDRDAGMFRFT